MTKPTTRTRPAYMDGKCAYKFQGSTNLCGAPADHPVHHGKWHGLEENHSFDHEHRFVCACGQER